MRMISAAAAPDKFGSCGPLEPSVIHYGYYFLVLVLFFSFLFLFAIVLVFPPRRPLLLSFLHQLIAVCVIYDLKR